MHQGRSRKHGVDCIGLLTVTLTELGYGFDDCLQYERYPDGVILPAILDAHLEPTDDPVPGDVLTFWIRKRGWIQHLAFKTDTGMIHTWYNVGRVVEHRFDERWAKRIAKTYKVPT